MSREDSRAIGRWLAVWAAMVALLVLIGGATRLTESGLSITEWQPVSGVIPPIGEAQWADEFAKYQRIPQYQLLNHGMTIGEFKSIYLWEYVHRLWARLLAVGFAIPFVMFIRARRMPRELWPRLAGIFVLLGLQGALGWWMVMSGLSGRTSVSQYRLAAHLVTALALYAFTTWTAAELINPRDVRGASDNNSTRNRALLVLALMVPLTAASGAFVAGLRAGKIYNSFPFMGAGIVPAEYGRLTPWWTNWFENPAAVQFNHRLLAMVTFALAMWVRYLSRTPANSRLERATRWVFAAALLQVVLGISTLVLSVPVALGVAHQAGMLLLLTAALLAVHANGRAARA